MKRSLSAAFRALSLERLFGNRGQARRPLRRAHLRMESLEDRCVPTTLEGITILEQPGLNMAPVTVVSQPTVFHDTLLSDWQKLLNGTIQINGQTLQQTVIAEVQQSAQSQGVQAYAISAGFNASPTYSGVFVQGADLTNIGSGPDTEVSLNLDATGNTLVFTTTTNSIFGSFANPTFHVTYDLDIHIVLDLPANLNAGSSVGVTAFAQVENAHVSSKNVLVNTLDAFGANITNDIQNQLDNQSQDLSSLVNTSLINTGLQAAAAKGFTFLTSSLNNNGTLRVTLWTPALVVHGNANDRIVVNTNDDYVVNGLTFLTNVQITVAGQTTTFSPYFLTSILILPGAGDNTVDIEGVQPQAPVTVDSTMGSTDSVTVGGEALGLANIEAPVSVSNSRGKTTLNVIDEQSTNAQVTVTNNSVQYDGRTVVNYQSNAGKSGVTALAVDANSSGSTVTVQGTAAGVPLTVQTFAGSNVVRLDNTSSAVSVNGVFSQDTVTVGNGSLTSIGGLVSVSNKNGHTQLTIDDESDTDGRTIALNSADVVFENLEIFRTGDVFHKEEVQLAQINLGANITSVTVDAPEGPANIIDAESSPSKHFFHLDINRGDTVEGAADAELVDTDYP